MGRRTLLLIAAVVIAAIGSTFVFIYAHDANNRALKDQEPQEVLVATKTIDAGTTAGAAEAAGAFDTKKVAKSSVVAGAVTLSDIEPIKDQVALAPIFAGEQILRQQFGAALTVSTLPIPKGKIAMSVQLGDPQRVAGFVRPGSFVAVFATLQGSKFQGTRLLIPKAQVIAVGPSTTISRTVTDANGTTNTENIPTAILTLGLSLTDSERLVFAQNGTSGGQGSLYFGLLSNTSVTSPDRGVNERNAFR